MRQLVVRYPVAAFVVFAYLWAWLLWGYWIPAMPPGGLVIAPAFLVMALAGGFGPSLAAFLLVLLNDGRDGLRQLIGAAAPWRVGPVWYAAALLLVPAVTAVSLAIQALFIDAPVWGNLAERAPIAVVWPIMAAIGEEFGWRGFLLPLLAARMRLLSASLATGIVWGIWHLPADYIALKAYGWWFLPAFFANGPLLLTAHAVIMGWLWARTGQSLAVMLVYHFSITATAILVPVPAEPAAAVAAAFVGASLVCLVALGLIVFRRADFGSA